MQHMDGTIFVIMGVTGDLATRKLIPALHELLKDGHLQKCAIIGVANDQTATIDSILEKSKSFIPEPNSDVLQKIRDVFVYQPFDFNDQSGYQKLKVTLENLESQFGFSGQRIFYLSVMPDYFAPITQNLALAGIIKKGDNSRIAYEKPFGHNLASAKSINKAIHSVFDESQIYRVDHFLGKELVDNIALVRFTNLFLQPLWNHQYIDNIQIFLNEEIDINHRGAFYDRYGALRDVVQNHMLQLLALIAMEPPKALDGQHIRDAKSAVLQCVKVEDVIKGQYAGYRTESGVNPNSTTETFAALRLSIENDRWTGVPFYLKTGKCLRAKNTSIHITFKSAQCMVSTPCPPPQNHLIINIDPAHGFALEINAKVSGYSNQIAPVPMTFCHSKLCPNSPEAYETLLFDIMKGDQSAFVRFDEIEHSWAIIDAAHAQHPETPPTIYEKGSQGPDELKIWAEKYNFVWRD